MKTIQIELTLDEADLIGAVVCRDRDRVLDEAFGNRGTRLISDQEESRVPVHQEILRKIETSLSTSAERPLNKAIDAMISIDQTSPAEDLLDKVRSLCNEFSLKALHIAIDVHRSSCHQSDCPVLAVMVTTAHTRDAQEGSP